MNVSISELFQQITADVKADGHKVTPLTGPMFDTVISQVPPYLKQEKAQVDLREIYEVGFHAATESVLVCNRGASLFTRSPLSGTPSCLFHMGFCIINLSHGCEMVNVGFAGCIESSRFVICRSESACAPSFIFGSQRCNCAEQWMVARELAARLNHYSSDQTDPSKFESDIAGFFTREAGGMPIPRVPGQSVVMIHMDSQNGMGSGTNVGEYSHEMTTTAFMRHRGEYTAEQRFSTSMAGGFETIGLTPDPRQLNNKFGYMIPTIVLDYFGIEKPIISLTNNHLKCEALSKAGYRAQAWNLVGRSDMECRLETRDRNEEFGHSIDPNLELTPISEVERLLADIEKMRA